MGDARSLPGIRGSPPSEQRSPLVLTSIKRRTCLTLLSPLLLTEGAPEDVQLPGIPPEVTAEPPKTCRSSASPVTQLTISGMKPPC